MHEILPNKDLDLICNHWEENENNRTFSLHHYLEEY